MIKRFATHPKMKIMEVQLFIPCFIDQLYPQTALNTTKVLNHLNVEVVYNNQQTCCGQIHFNGGYRNYSVELATKFLHDFNTDTLIVSPSASCISYIKNHYKDLELPKKTSYKCKILKNNLFELTDFILNELNINSIEGEFNHKITYHDSCSALREYGIKEEPRILLRSIKGLEIIEMEESETCCGFGGTFSIKNEAISTAMAQQKIEFAMDTGAEYIVSTELSCLMHLAGYIKKHKLKIKAISVADILAEAIKNIRQ